MTYCRTVTVVQSNSLGLVLKPILSVKVFAPPLTPSPEWRPDLLLSLHGSWSQWRVGCNRACVGGGQSGGPNCLASFSDTFWHFSCAAPVIIAPSCCFSVVCDLSPGPSPTSLLELLVQLADSDSAPLMTHCFGMMSPHCDFFWIPGCVSNSGVLPSSSTNSTSSLEKGPERWISLLILTFFLFV